MEAVVIPVVLIFVALVVVGVVRRTRRADEVWARVAEKLDLQVSPAGFFSRNSLRGTVGGLGVNVRSVTQGAGDSSRTCTVYRIRYPSLRLGLRLKPRGTFAGLGRLFGGPDRLVGHPAFDDEVVVQGRSAADLKRFLTPERRMRILRAMANNPRLSITDTELETSTDGLEREPARMEDRIRRLLNLARVLTSPSRDDIAHGREVAGEHPLATGPTEEAANVLEPLREAAPDDVEVTAPTGVARRVVKAPPPPPQEPDEERPAGSSVEDSPSTDALVDVKEISETLFGSGTMSFEGDRVFEARYAGKPVRWTGELRRVDSFHRDRIFGEGPGTKAAVEVHEVGDAGYGGREVFAVVRLSVQTGAALRARRGDTVAFEGRLVRWDPFMRNLFVDDGRLVE